MRTSANERNPSLALAAALLLGWVGCDQTVATVQSHPLPDRVSAMSARVEALLDEQRGPLRRGTLHIGLAGLTDGELLTLLADDRVGPLDDVHLSGNALTDAAVEHLIDSPKLAGLTRLILAEQGVGGRGIERLLAWPGLSTLHTLDLSGTGGAPADYAALDPARLPRLSTLRLVGVRLDARAVAPLVGLSARTLALDYTGLDAAAACALLAHTRAESVGLSHNALGPGALLGLHRFSPALTALDLSSTGLSSGDVVHLASLPDAPEVLDLGRVRAGDAGLEALARAPWLARAVALVVIDPQASPAAKAALRRAWGPRGGLTL